MHTSGLREQVYGPNGYLWRSSDYGETWTEVTSNPGQDWRYIAMSASGDVTESARARSYFLS